MLGWLYGILVGTFCNHKWEILREGKLRVNGHEAGFYYDLRCPKCGNIKCKRT